MEEKVVKILNEMSEYLSITQMKKLQEVILKVFAEEDADKVEITKKSVNQASFAIKDLKQIEIEIPSLSEQDQIVKILDKLQNLIELKNNELSALDDLIRARFVEMFGDAVVNPMHWPVKRLKELSVQINSGNTPKGGSENYVEEGITFFRSQNVWKDHLEMDDIAYIDVETHASMKKSSLKKGGYSYDKDRAYKY